MEHHLIYLVLGLEVFLFFLLLFRMFSVKGPGVGVEKGHRKAWTGEAGTRDLGQGGALVGQTGEREGGEVLTPVPIHLALRKGSPCSGSLWRIDVGRPGPSCPL